MIFEPVFEPIRAGNLIVRLAINEAEVVAAQELRYRIFCEEMGGQANPEVQAQKRDFDKYDEVCHHLLVIDDSRDDEHQVVGTYRLLTRDNMETIGSFYTESEYDVDKIKANGGKLLELGRSCVEQQYRTRPVLGSVRVRVRVRYSLSMTGRSGCRGWARQVCTKSGVTTR